MAPYRGVLRPAMTAALERLMALNPLGAKGAGEGGTNAAGAAVAATVDHAIGRPGSIIELPITPDRLRSTLADRMF
jgi:carbon-monoxide dehydrogenase large subunit